MEQRGRHHSAHLNNDHSSRLPQAIQADRKQLDENSSLGRVDDYTSPMLPPRKLAFPNNRSEFEKRHASLHIEPNENYQRMRASMQNDSVRAVYRNRLHPEDIVNTGPVTAKPGSVSLSPDLGNAAGTNLFSGLPGHQVKASRSGQLGNASDRNGQEQELQPVTAPDQKRGSAPEIRFKPKLVAITAKDVHELMSRVADMEALLKQRTAMALKRSTIVDEYHGQVEAMKTEHNRKKAKFDEKHPKLKTTRDEAKRLKL